MKALVLAAVFFITLTSGGTKQDTDFASGDSPAPVATAPLQPEELVTSPENELVLKAQAPLLANLGDYQRTISTSDSGAQRYFEQGMVMAAAFNHAEAIRSFQAAQRLDPKCAMCFWGEALANGPNINVTSNGKAIMQPEQRLAAFTAIQRAQALKASATHQEQDYIEALAERYAGDTTIERDSLDLAYAAAMSKLAAKYPEDDDAQALFAEAVMTTIPWDYWLDAEHPKPEAGVVIRLLEKVIKRNPRHALALHLYIHAVEASSNPARAEAAADTLLDLVPGAGHLVHMPSHIYWRVGRYHDASEANVRAAAVDESYIRQCNAQGFYPALYYPHNIHFLWAAASMEGRSGVAIEAGIKLAANVRLEQIREYPAIEFFHTVPLQSLLRFGRWDDVLAYPQPDRELKFSNAIWHYARGVAYARQHNQEQAEVELAALQPLKSTEAIYFLDGNDYPASQLLTIADALLRGEIAMASNNPSAAVSHFKQAVAAQDSLPYTEPPFWYYPTRQSLGQALMAAREYSEAEREYRADLRQYPRNGWSMHGLALSLEAQGEKRQAKRVQRQFEKLWARSDITLPGSVM